MANICRQCGTELKPSETGNRQTLCGKCRYRNKRVGTCTNCGRTAKITLSKGLCNRCQHRTEPCGACGKERKVVARTPEGSPLCSTCGNRSRPKETCCICGRLGRVNERLPEGPVCELCYMTRSFAHQWGKLVRGARRRGRNRDRPIEVSITREEFRVLAESHCHYCGDPPDGKTHRFLGIDRVDNDLGYITGNCVPCCWPCNRAKGTMSCQEFLEVCRKVSAHNRL